MTFLQDDNEFSVAGVFFSSDLLQPRHQNMNNNINSTEYFNAKKTRLYLFSHVINNKY